MFFFCTNAKKLFVSECDFSDPSSMSYMNFEAHPVLISTLVKDIVELG